MHMFINYDLFKLNTSQFVFNIDNLKHLHRFAIVLVTREIERIAISKSNSFDVTSTWRIKTFLYEFSFAYISLIFQEIMCTEFKYIPTCYRQQHPRSLSGRTFSQTMKKSNRYINWVKLGVYLIRRVCFLISSEDFWLWGWIIKN